MAIVKRIIQVGEACLLLILTSPIFLVGLAVTYLFTSRHPIYQGMRVGKDGKQFRMYKIRSLKDGAETHIANRLLRPNDPYLTRVGRIIRRLKIDELPQLFNIIKGEMNFIGPRPIRPIFYEHFLDAIPGYEKKFKSKPGLTGLAQVMGDYETPAMEKLRYEVYYNSRKGIRLDTLIIFKTLIMIFVNIFNRKDIL